MSAVVTAPAGTETAQGRPARRRRGRLLLPVYSWLVIAYLVLPIFVMVAYSFNKVNTGLPQVSFAWNGFTTQWYQQWSSVPGLTSAFWLTIRLGITSTILATVVGTLLALALPGRPLQLIFAVLMIVVGCRLLRDSRRLTR